MIASDKMSAIRCIGGTMRQSMIGYANHQSSIVSLRLLHRRKLFSSHMEKITLEIGS